MTLEVDSLQYKGCDDAVTGVWRQTGYILILRVFRVGYDKIKYFTFIPPSLHPSAYAQVCPRQTKDISPSHTSPSPAIQRRKQPPYKTTPIPHHSSITPFTHLLPHGSPPPLKMQSPSHTANLQPRLPHHPIPPMDLRRTRYPSSYSCARYPIPSFLSCVSF
jgi:hypothetical protein